MRAKWKLHLIGAEKPCCSGGGEEVDADRLRSGFKKKENRETWNYSDRPSWTPDTTLVAEYDYRRRDGTYSYTIRKGLRPDGEKTFQTRRTNMLSYGERLDPEDMPDYFFGLGDEKPVLYRLPELIEASKKPKFRPIITEGEKDAETAKELGYVATCNPFGAGKWRDEFSPYLAGGDCIVPPDNDVPGGKHADQVIASIMGYAKSITRLTIPKEFKDLTEWREGQQKAGLSIETIIHNLEAMIQLNFGNALKPSTIPAEPTTTPIDLWSKFNPPQLPTGLLPPVIEQFALEQGTLMGSDPAGLAGAAIAVCSAAIPDFIKIKVKRHSGWMELTRAWIGLVGDPSSKKTPIINRATKRITSIDAAMRRAYQIEKKKWDALSKEDKKTVSPPKQTFLKLDDTTIEAAQPVLQDSPNGVLCHKDELSGWFGSMDKYAGHKGAMADRAFWLRAYDGHSYSWDRTSRGSGLIENLSISVLGGIQPEPMQKLVEGSVDDGLIQRIIPIMVRRGSVGTDAPESPAAERYDDLVTRLRETKAPFEDITFDDGAREIRNELERRHNDLIICEALNKKLAAHIGKYDGIFARLCLLWHCIENTDIETEQRITAATTRRVADFLHSFLLPHALAFYTDVLGGSEARDRLAAVAGFILARKIPVLTNRIIQRGDRTMRALDQREAEQVCQQLDALGWVNRVPGTRAGDPPHWHVNPEVHRLFEDRARQEDERRSRHRAMLAELFATKGLEPS